MRFSLPTSVHQSRTRVFQSYVAAVALCGTHIALARVVLAQDALAVTPAAAAVITRARTMADAGSGDKAHTLLDSLVAAVPRESIDAAEALYWRASLADQSSNAERDWKRLVVEIPQSARVPDALLRLSELDITNNNTVLARQHAKRILSDYPDAPQRSRAMIVLARTYFTDNDAPRACGVLTVVRREAPLSAVEVRLQADEMQQQCRNVREVAMGAAPDATAALPVAPLTPMPAAPSVRDVAVRDAAARDVAARDAAARDVAARDAAARDVTAREATARDAATRGAAVRDSIAANKAARARAAADARDAELARKAALARDAAAKKAAAARAAAEARDSADAREAAAARQAEIASEAAAARDAAARETAARDKEARRSATTTKLPPSTPPAVPTTGRWTIQVAAYDTRAQADALVKKLIANDLAAHTVGARKPFRVQVGRFETRTDAMDALTVMKTKGQNGFISEWAKR